MATKHNHRVVFGRKEANCPRCEELKNGAAPIVWSWSKLRRQNEAIRLEDIKTHDFNACAERNGCCTHFEW